MSENIFADEWVECLEAHYMHVIRTNDKVTEPSLSIVMHSAGFSDAQLAELRVRATMRADEMGEDFMPDLDILDAHDHSHDEPEAVEAHVYSIPVDVAPALVEEGQPTVVVEVEAVITEETIDETELEDEPLDDDAPVEPEPEAKDDDEPQQLSLF